MLPEQRKQLVSFDNLISVYALGVGDQGIEPQPVLDDYRFTVCADLSQYSAVSQLTP